LIADLLGATLVDARDELRAAWSALEAAGAPPNPPRWTTEPPTWPPASVAKLLARRDETAMAMVETLAGQLATNPSVRSWLVRSWLSPAPPIGRSVLRERTRSRADVDKCIERSKLWRRQASPVEWLAR
jgi:hypothetical protein